MKLAIAVLALLVAPSLYGQGSVKPEKGDYPAAKKEAPAAAVPQLKTEVELELTKARMELYEILLNMKTAETQYQQAQQTFNDKQTKFAGMIPAALEKSGIDKAKFELNPGTFAVTAKPEAPKEVPKKN